MYKSQCFSCVHCSVYHCSEDVGTLSPVDASADASTVVE